MRVAHSLPPPTAAGQFSEKPPEHLLLYVRGRKLTGSLVFADPNAERALAEIFLESGRVRKIRSQQPAYLGSVLYELGLIDVEAMNRSLAQVAQSKALAGAVLRGSGAIDAATLQRGLTEQMERKLEYLVSLPRSVAWSFHTGVDVLEGFGGSDWPLVDCLGAVWRGLRESPFFDAIEAAVSRARGQRFVFKKEAEGSLSRLSEEEGAMVRAFQAGATIGEIACGLSEGRKTRLFYFLLLTNVLSPVAAPASFPPQRSPVPPPPESASRLPRSESRLPSPPPASSHTPAAPFSSPPRRPDSTASMRIPQPPESSPAPRISEAPSQRSIYVTPTPGSMQIPSFRVPPTLDAPEAPPASIRRPASAPPSQPAGPAGDRRAQILEMAESLDKLDHFGVLSLPKSANSDEVRDQFYKLSRTFHPDKLPADLKDLEEICSRIASRLGEAHAVLSDPHRRAAHVAELVRAQASVPTPASNVLRENAKITIQKALKALPRSYAEAAELADRARATDDGKSPLVAVVAAWIGANHPAQQADTDLRAALKTFDTLVKDHPDFADAYYYRAQIHKRLRQGPAALKDLKATLDCHADHTDASRELRLFRMRTDGGMPADEALGIPKR